jgi:hypothetical protein
MSEDGIQVEHSKRNQLPMMFYTSDVLYIATFRTHVLCIWCLLNLAGHSRPDILSVVSVMLWAAACMKTNQNVRRVYLQHVRGQPVALLVAIIATIAIAVLAF